MLVRPLPADRWPVLRVLRLAALQDAPGAFAATYERERDQTDDGWRARAAGAAWFVAWAGDEPVGLAGAVGEGDERHLISMWVDPRWRGRRVAAHLAGAVLGRARTDGAGAVTLWVADGNAAAERSYRRLGFVPTGRRQPLPSNPAVGEAEFALRLRGG